MDCLAIHLIKFGKDIIIKEDFWEFVLTYKIMITLLWNIPMEQTYRGSVAFKRLEVSCQEVVWV